ncbi:MAG: shikimate dehydrogenase, partial [Acidobacteriota bacterium]|nr:shikimate dehydrogenase [Acidobacteriota bacterium]
EQGGKRALDLGTRLSFRANDSSLHQQACSSENFADIELDLAVRLMKREEAGGGGSGNHLTLDWTHIICSHHDFAGMPADLERIYEWMSQTPARILKIAVQADEITDCIQVFRLLERARRDGREMIAVAMGEAGIMTRVLATSRGAFLTFGSIDESGATAPGQLSAADLRDLYRINSINEETKITGLVGSPTAHSVSPQMHNAAFAACNVNGVYLPFEVRDIDEFMRRMVHPRSREIKWNLCGLSVTAPHKRAVMNHLDWIDPIAEKIGAVNTIRVKGDALHGYNTDAAASLAPLEGTVDLRGANVAVIGAGGAARAVLWRLREVHARATLFARDATRAAKTASDFDARCESLDGARVANFFAKFDVVINTTPLGTDGHSVNETPATAGELRGARLAYDLVYNPPTTRFMREARDAGCQVFGGLPMLVAQAAAQFKLWTNCDAPLDVMCAAASRRQKAEGRRQKAEGSYGNYK